MSFQAGASQQQGSFEASSSPSLAAAPCSDLRRLLRGWEESMCVKTCTWHGLGTGRLSPGGRWLAQLSGLCLGLDSAAGGAQRHLLPPPAVGTVLCAGWGAADPAGLREGTWMQRQRSLCAGGAQDPGAAEAGGSSGPPGSPSLPHQGPQLVPAPRPGGFGDLQGGGSTAPVLFGFWLARCAL